MSAHNWMATHWKPAAAFVYTLICFFDFVIFPSYVGWNKVDLFELIEQIKGMDPSIQSQLIRSATLGFEPLTLRGSGLFHLAFGALLTGAAIVNNGGVVYGKRGAQFARRSEDLDRLEKEDRDAGSPPKED